MAHVTTNFYSGTLVTAGATAEHTVAVNAGAGANRVVLIEHFRRTDRCPVINSVTIGGESMSVLSSDRVVSGLYSTRIFVRVNPTVSGTQNVVIQTTSNGSNSVSYLLVAVYDDVDPAATPADLLTIEGSQTVATPWTGPVTLDIPSATGRQAVAMLKSMSSDVSYALTPDGGQTSRYNSVSGGIGTYSGDAAGAATVACEWSISGLTQDAGFTKYGFSLPPPSGGTTLVYNDLVSSFEALAYVSQDLGASYAASAYVSTDLAASYYAQAFVASDLAANYDTSALVAQDLAASFNVGAYVASDLEASFAANEYVNQDLVGSYSAQAYISADLEASYGAGAFVSQDLAASYVTVVYVNQDLGVSFSASSYISQDLAGSYLTTAAVLADLLALFDTHAYVNQDLAASYDTQDGGASIRRWPLAILESSNLLGVVANIQDDPDAPDASWLLMN